jgi:hypothetical protein
MVLLHIPHARLRPAHQDEKQSPLHRSCFQVLFGQVVLAFSPQLITATGVPWPERVRGG